MGRGRAPKGLGLSPPRPSDPRPGLRKPQDPKVPEENLSQSSPGPCKQDHKSQTGPSACRLPPAFRGLWTSNTSQPSFDVRLLQRDPIPCKHARGGVAQSLPDLPGQLAELSVRDSGPRGHSSASRSRPLTHPQQEPPAPLQQASLKFQTSPRGLCWASREAVCSRPRQSHQPPREAGRGCPPCSRRHLSWAPWCLGSVRPANLFPWSDGGQREPARRGTGEQSTLSPLLGTSQTT